MFERGYEVPKNQIPQWYPSSSGVELAQATMTGWFTDLPSGKYRVINPVIPS
jgi:hypothetical protein